MLISGDEFQIRNTKSETRTKFKCSKSKYAHKYFTRKMGRISPPFGKGGWEGFFERFSDR